MNTERLIELVRQNAILYDLRNQHYLNSKKKNIIWDNIGKELKCEASVCKSRWNNIRDHYRKSLKNTATRSGQGRESQKRYKYHEELSFLRPYFQERETISNIIAESENSTSDTVLDSGSPHSAQSPSALADEEVVISIPSPVHSSHRTGSLSPAASSSSLASSQETSDKPKSAAATLLDYVLKKNQNNSTEAHPIDKFLHGIAPTLKNLTPYYQNLAKTDIFSIVQKYEMIMFERHMEVQNVENDVQIIFETSTPSAGTGCNLQVHEELPEITQPSPYTSTSAPTSMQGKSAEPETLFESILNPTNNQNSSKDTENKKRLSIAIQRGNAASLLGTFPAISDAEEYFDA